MDTREKLIQQLNTGRQEILSLLEILDRNREVYPSWTAKELLAHFTGWDDATIASLKAHARGDVPATPAERGIDFYNAQTVSTRESLDFDHVYKEWETARAELLAVIQDMPQEKLEDSLIMPWGHRGPVAELIQIMAYHEVEHAEEIKARLKKAEEAVLKK